LSEKQINNETDDGLNFLDHLDELRKRLIYAVLGILAGSVLAGIFIEELLQFILLKPASIANMSLQNLKPFGLPFLYIKIIFLAGIIVSFPFTLYQIWKFVAPGLYENEKSWARKITYYTSLCFLGGIVFAYYVMLPTMLKFAAGFGSEFIRNDIDVTNYFSFITMILLAAGVLFEMPVVSYVLTKAGIVTPKILRKYWRHSIVGILVLAAVLTPTPDPVSQMIFASPLFILYELSILVSKLASRKIEKE
jgi:sec-independent protein translocase protein TatC